MDLDLTTTVLPDHDDLMRRLTAVDASHHAQQRLHPRILDLAGQEKTGLAVAMALTLAAVDYTAGLPPVAAATVMLRLPAYARAIIDDPQVQAEAVDALEPGL